MPLFIDIHQKMEGLTAQKIADAHQMDLKVQDKYGVEFVTYWFNEDEGTVFCLCQAPSKEAAIAVHREAHGHIPNVILEVQEGA